MAIYDVVTGAGLLGDFSKVSSSPHISAAGAYTTWADGMGVSSVDTLSSLDGDDVVFTLDLGFPLPVGVPETKVFFTTEGQLSFFGAPFTGTVDATSGTGIGYGDVSVSRAMRTVTPKQVATVICKSKSMDARAESTKWQKSANEAIIFYRSRAYSANTHVVEVAIRLTPGKLEYVATVVSATDANLQFFVFNRADGTITEATNVSGTLTGTSHYITGPRSVIAGVVKDASGAVASRTVRVYRRSTGALMREVVSSGLTGEYTIDMAYAKDEMQVVCLDDAAGFVKNDLILRAVPE